MLSLFSAGVAWVVVVMRARPSFAAPGDPTSARSVSAAAARRALWATVLTLAIAWTLRVRAVYDGVDRLSGIGNLAQLLGDVTGLGTGLAILAVLRSQGIEAALARRATRQRAAVLMVAAAVMVVCFAAGSFGRESTDFVADYARQGWYWGYQAAFLAYLGYVFVEVIILCQRFALLGVSPLLRVGLRLAAVGGGCGLAYVLARAGYIAAAQTRMVTRLGSYPVLSQLLLTVGSALIIVGLFLPAVGPRLLRRRYGHAYAEIEALWTALAGADLVHPLPVDTVTDPRGRTVPAEPGFALHRRVIEIRDGLLGLRPWLPTATGHGPHGATRAARARGGQRITRGPSTTELTHAREEAITITKALSARALGIPGAVPPVLVEPRGSGTFADELRWLRAVSTAYRDLTGRADSAGSVDPPSALSWNAA